MVNKKSPLGEARTRGIDLSAVNLPLLMGQRGRRVDATKQNDPALVSDFAL